MKSIGKSNDKEKMTKGKTKDSFKKKQLGPENNQGGGFVLGYTRAEDTRKEEAKKQKRTVNSTPKKGGT